METSVSNTLFKQIENDILIVSLLFGLVLTKPTLSEHYKLSRTPLGMALAAATKKWVIERLLYGMILVCHFSYLSAE